MSTQTLANIDGMLKPVFGDLVNVIPDEMLVQRLFAFKPPNTGQFLQEPVLVRAPWGLTFLGTDGSGAASDGALNDPAPFITTAAQVTPSAIVERSAVNYTNIDRSAGDAQAFQNVATLTAMEIMKQLRRIIEVNALCGQSGLMTVLSYDNSTDIVTLLASSIRPGFLALMEGAKVDTLDPTTLVPRAQSTFPQGLVVSGVDVAAGTMSLSTDPDNDPQVGDLISLHGAIASTTSFQEPPGLQKQISAQTGTIFNVNRATYSLSRGNVKSSFGPMTVGALLGAAALAQNKGLTGRAVVLMSPKRWAALNSKDIANQRFDSSYAPSQAMMGTKAIKIQADGFSLECYSHSFVADGEAFIVPLEYCKRVGSGYNDSGKDGRDVTFKVPGTSLEYVYPLQGFAAVEFQCRTDQTIYLQRPAISVYCSGITD